MQWTPGRNYLQGVSETKTYCFDWTAWLNGEKITSFTVTAQSGLTASASQKYGTQVYVSVTSPTLGVPKTLTCQITSSANPYAQTVSREITIEGT